MANRYYTEPAFTLEKRVVTLSARVVFNPSGVPVLDTNNSKGICAIWPETVSFVGAVTNSLTSIGTVSSFAGLMPGMTVTGSAGSLAASSKIASVNPANLSVILNNQAILTGADEQLVASGGRYRIQFGSQAVTRLDTYAKLLYTHITWDETTSSAIGTGSLVALTPNAPQMFIADNKIGVKTVPPTLATSSTDASLVFQLGYNTSSASGAFFNAANPSTGESCRILFVFSNSTAI